ncbi:MAG: hypothetical protein NZ656_05185 [Nitrospinaceae bacterium]|nr:hypothetical protein [Nitrospinaceae bacterium]
MTANDFYAQGSRQQFVGQGQDLTIKHVPSGTQVEFPAFLDLFSDNFSSQWNSEDVYGRMDPIATFVNTRRSLSVAWWVPADSFEHAQENLAKANKIMSFLYPTYSSRSGGATVINQGPLLRVSFGNLIKRADGSGLLGYVNGFTFDPALEYGMFNRKMTKEGEKATSSITTKNPQNNEYFPKTFRLNFELIVLHEHSLGWKPGYNNPMLPGASATFPYNLGKDGKPDLSHVDRRRQAENAEKEKKNKKPKDQKKKDTNTPGKAIGSKALRPK